MAYYVVGPDGRESGPYELDALIGWARAGQLPRHAPVRDSGSSSAVRADQLIELAPYFPAGAAPGSAKGSFVLPMGNPDALWGYYLGWASLLCFIGMLAAPFSVWRCLRGMRAYRADPSVHGMAHSVVGLCLVGLSVMGHAGVILVILQA